MTECFDDNIAAEFIDGVLSAAEVKRVEKHAARCSACRQLLAELGRSPSLSPALSPTLPAAGDAGLALNTGQTVGRFVVLSRVGSGGMGVVFAAYDPKLDRKVALKLLHSPESTSLSAHDAQMRLLREAQAMAQLSHPNVIAVYDVGTFQSEVYIAMEFVDGTTLTRWLDEWERPWLDILDKFVQAGKALGDAHAAGLVHRDFKPDNVLVGGDSRVRVMDFGLARWLYADGPVDDPGAEEERAPVPPTGNALERRLTVTGALLGTPRYMAPEQLAGLSADARSDQFSFCVALYESLYRQHPFADHTAAGLVRSPEATAVLPPPAGTNVPVWLHRALLRGLEADPMKRYASMGALLRAMALPARSPVSRWRMATPLAVSLAAVMAAGYFYGDRQMVVDDLDAEHNKSEQLEKRLADLQKRSMELRHEFKQLELVLDEQNTQVVELQHQLDDANAQLEATITELERTRKQLNKIPPRPRARVIDAGVRLAGLRADEVQARIGKDQFDLDVCFREWREREQADQPLFAVRLEIDSQGIPRPGSRSGGMGDQVVYKCVAGLLERMRFPESDGVTVIDLGFRNEPKGLRVSAKVKEVLVDSNRPM